jgi:hypothetical protein
VQQLHESALPGFKYVHHRSGLCVSLLVVTAVCLAIAGSRPNLQQNTIRFIYHARIPLGSQTFAVKKWNSVLTVLASAENPRFEGWRREQHGEKEILLDGSGQPVRNFPDQLSFRISVGTRTHLSDDEPFTLNAKLPVNDYLLQLKFRLKIFHGLYETVVEPENVALIGVPSDVAYDERIYHAAFALPLVPIEDRIILEVLTPHGERLCKFHLDLQ